MKPLYVYAGLVGILIILLVYYKGFVNDVNAAGPFALKFFALGQGRNPNTFNFSPYAAG
jgi:hypothetical protein